MQLEGLRVSATVRNGRAGANRAKLPCKFEEARARGTLRRAVVQNACIGRRGPSRICIPAGTTGELLVDAAETRCPAFWFRQDGLDSAVRVSRDCLTLIDRPSGDERYRTSNLIRWRSRRTHIFHKASVFLAALENTTARCIRLRLRDTAGGRRPARSDLAVWACMCFLYSRTAVSSFASPTNPRVGISTVVNSVAIATSDCISVQNRSQVQHRV